ncbi:MAG: conjugal transfer protein TraX [Bifidobacteriaceae bacterium]|jgi:hypothetical protein|nr:conjugal transfer protein TraX [Bifidobacteriaceae bacterium]
MEERATRRRRRRGLSQKWLKIIGLTLLAGSMVGTAVVQKDMPADLAEAGLGRLSAAVVLEAASWAAAPIYAHLVCAGFRHTRSAWRYGLRLALLAIICEVPYDLATSGRAWDMTSQNPVFAVLVSLVVLALGASGARLQAGSRLGRAGLWAALGVAGALWLVFFNVGLRLGVMPVGLEVLVFTLVFWLLRTRQNTMMLVGGGIGALAGVFPALGFVFVHFDNGRPGLRGWPQRRIFYALYPLCLAVAGAYRALAP